MRKAFKLRDSQRLACKTEHDSHLKSAAERGAVACFAGTRVGRVLSVCAPMVLEVLRDLRGIHVWDHTH